MIKLNYIFSIRSKQFSDYYYDIWCDNSNVGYSNCDCDLNNKILIKDTIIIPYGPNILYNLMVKKKIFFKDDY